ncbi:MAG: SIMPL domain-containing protein [Thermoguttaceae bacterium]
MWRKKFMGLVVLSLAAFLPGGAQAQLGQGLEIAMLQASGKQGISAVGTATVKRKPTQLRLYMQLLAKGKTLEDALTKLKERCEAAAAQLEALKVDKKSIVFGPPALSATQSNRKRQIEAMVMAQMRARGKKVPKGLQTPQTVTVSATLTAQWALESESFERMLTKAQDIQEKIKAADLAGVKELEATSPEEAEFAEEANQMAPQFGGEQQEQPGEAHFMYVATLSKAERDRAMTEAFRNAQQKADEIAKTAGVARGNLLSVAGACSGQNEVGRNGFAGYVSFNENNFLQQMLAADRSDKTEPEAMSANPSVLQFNCNVTAIFQIGN